MSIPKKLPDGQAFQMALAIKKKKKKKKPSCQCRRHKTPKFDPWIGKVPWRKAWQHTPVFLPGEFHGQKRLTGYSPWGLKEMAANEPTSQARQRSHDPGHQVAVLFSRVQYISSCLTLGLGLNLQRYFRSSTSYFLCPVTGCFFLLLLFPSTA